MKLVITSLVLAGSMFAALSASADPRSHLYNDRPAWAQDAFLDGTQR